MAVIDALTSYVAHAIAHFAMVFLAPGSFLSPTPLVMAATMGGIVVLTQMRRAGERVSLSRLLGALFPRSIYAHRSARLDYAVLAINEGLLFFTQFFFVVGAAQVAERVAAMSGRAIEAGDAGPWEIAAFTVFIVLVWDFSASFTHYLKHRVPLLWELHKVHHSAEVLTPITAFRRHPLETVVNQLCQALMMGLGAGVWMVAFGAPGEPLTVFGIYAGVYVWRLLGYNLRHSHIALDYGPFWSRIFISPLQHQIHHSDDPRHYDSNFGHIFAFWDSLFGTLYVPKGDEQLTYGIDAEDMREHATLGGLYMAPLKNIAERLTPSAGAARTPRLEER
ncbi:MAG: sterol desaturase family protein [Caulobacterales bacterium]|nr:sterol desaturase family protein [Caulobacterales bacterium]